MLIQSSTIPKNRLLFFCCWEARNYPCLLLLLPVNVIMSSSLFKDLFQRVFAKVIVNKQLICQLAVQIVMYENYKSFSDVGGFHFRTFWPNRDFLLQKFNLILKLQSLGIKHIWLKNPAVRIPSIFPISKSILLL